MCTRFVVHVNKKGLPSCSEFEVFAKCHSFSEACEQVKRWARVNGLRLEPETSDSRWSFENGRLGEYIAAHIEYPQMAYEEIDDIVYPPFGAI